MKMERDILRSGALFIGGDWRPALDGATDEVVNPATGEVIGNVPASGAADVDAAVAAASAAFAASRRARSATASTAATSRRRCISRCRRLGRSVRGSVREIARMLS